MPQPPRLAAMQPDNHATRDLRTVVAAGFWRDNMALVQMLGLCPLLAVTTSVVNGLALGLATAGVLTLTNTVIAMMRRALIPFVRIPLFVLIIAALVTCVDLLTSAVLDDLHQVLGLFIPLIVTNCAVLAQAETVASRKPVGEALVTGLATGFGFLAVLVALGALRELLGHGTLLAGLPMLAGERAAWLEIHLPFDGMLAAILPPGAFFGMAALLALRNRLARERPAPAATPEAAAEAEL
jgi:Na+-translocating ferredoxin:NAD+ oxidoreductase subunit E